ncbi:hypothetical protein ZWY2020_008823 [Hordeum vulgare]|nr:hypothetical protein ZWY2020_008823 [Hordeum vulgare]
MTKGQTSKLESQKKKKKKGAASPGDVAPLGWIQGDFLPSTVTADDFLELVEHGVIANKSWRLPEGETEPAPKEGERVMLLSHVFRGFSLPPQPFFRDRLAPPRQLALSKGEKIQIQPLVDALIAVVRKGVTGTDFLDTFLGRRIQPLQDRHHAMWHHAGPEDSTRTHPECVTGETVIAWVHSITRACDNPRGAPRVKPFRADNPPPNEEWTNWYSAVSNGNPAEEEEGSQEGSMDSVEYVSDSGETKEETEEEEEKVGEQSSQPPPSEHRTKHRHDPADPLAPPAAPSAPPAPPVAPSARSVKRTRDAAAEPTDQAATSATSLPRQDDDPTDTDNAATSQQVGLPSEVIHLEDDDQRGSGLALAPVLEVVPSAAAPTMNEPPTETMPPTETVPLAAEPTGAELGMPKESSVLSGPSTIQYDARHLPEDQVGAAKDAMVQVELMVGDAKGAYDSIASLYKKILELRDDIRIRADLPEYYQWGHSECTHWM